MIRTPFWPSTMLSLVSVATTPSRPDLTCDAAGAVGAAMFNPPGIFDDERRIPLEAPDVNNSSHPGAEPPSRLISYICISYNTYRNADTELQPAPPAIT